MADDVESGPADGALPNVSLSPGFGAWLYGLNATLCLSTYRSGRLITVGIDDQNRVRLASLSLGRCMGLAADGAGLWASTTTQIWRFVRSLSAEGGDAEEIVLLPQLCFGTGYLNIHDVDVNGHGRPVFANTLFNCVAVTDETSSFIPIWQPPFISAIVPEDRCHLNGIALEDGRVRFATGLGETDTPEGWRETKTGGWLIDVAQPDRPPLQGLHQPHSPRLHEGALWLLQSGAGQFGRVRGGAFETVYEHDGYPRGLSFFNQLAFIGLSKERRPGEFDDTPLGNRLSASSTEAACGLDIVDPKTGERVHWLRFETGITELFDVAVLAGHTNQRLIGPGSDAALRHYAIGGLRPAPSTPDDAAS